MNRRLARGLYRCILCLHPPAFRREFGDEMLWIFDEEHAKCRHVRLIPDALASLGRQWVLRGVTPEATTNPVSIASGHLFAWQHIGLPGARLPVLRIVQGGAVTALFLAILAFAMAQPGNRLPVLAAAMGQAPSGGVSGGVNGGVNGGVPGANGNGPSGGVRRDGTNSSGGLVPGTQNSDAKTAAEQQAAAWLEGFNSGDKAKFQAFLEKNYPDEAKRIDGLMGFRSMTGGFDVEKTEKVTDTAFVAIVKERDSDTFARMEIEVEPAEPYRVTKFDVSIIPIPVEFAIPRMSEGDAILALKSEIERRVDADRFSGTVMVTKNGKPIFSGAYGLADRDRKLKNDLGTQFRIGSMNKMFTAVATMQLVQNGKLKLDGTVGEYLSDYPNKDLALKVTIHHLLTHTGGTGDFFGPEFDKHRLELRTLEDYVKLYGQRGLEFEPGSKWDYSNYGFLLLGMIVQKVSGQDYYEYVREHVYKPAGMTSTDSLPEDQTVAKRSVGYMKDGGSDTWKPNTGTLPYRGTSAGGGYSTVEDLQKFAQALKEDKLLDAKNTEMLTTGKADTGGGDKYSYGFMDRTSGGVRSYGHGGGAPGMNGELAIYPRSGYVIAVLANLDPPAAQRIASFIGNRLPEK
jgi:D-alanyl-D-alanine carboxypeptidase